MSAFLWGMFNAYRPKGSTSKALAGTGVFHTSFVDNFVVRSSCRTSFAPRVESYAGPSQWNSHCCIPRKGGDGNIYNEICRFSTSEGLELTLAEVLGQC